MKRFRIPAVVVLILLGAAIAYAVPAPTLDPAPGTFIGQTTVVTNHQGVAVTVGGDTSIRLPAAITLPSKSSITLVWDGTYWRGTGTDRVNRGTITLVAGTGTATVESGAVCACSDTSAVPLVLRCSVATTTLTVTEAGGTNVIAYVCL